jgi:glucose-1-phosphate thymidylyltransferase
MSSWIGLILAGGTGSRLYPLTRAINKHLLPVFDKPMIYYPLTTLMLAGIRDFVVVSSPEALPMIEATLASHPKWGIRCAFAAQPEPKGIADGLLSAADLIADRPVALILGDNIFYGTGLPAQIRRAMQHEEGATIFGYAVSNPEGFGIVEIDSTGRPVALEEKPARPRSNLAVPGLYLYDRKALAIARGLAPSARGEFEITDLNKAYMKSGNLRVSLLGRGTAWLDGGTPAALFMAAQFVEIMEKRTGTRIACPEEVAYRMGYIGLGDLAALAAEGSDDYTGYLRCLVEEERARKGAP